jgi:pSer/pThr/pTyr-binding forkhead associated (FHA) protein
MDIVLLALRILIVIALYAFLGVVLFVLLREQRQPAVRSQPVPPQPARLTQLTETADLSQGSGSKSDDRRSLRQYTLNAVTWIGRDPNCLVRADDEFTSARHAQLIWREDEGTWWIEDNASRNGTFVNGERVMRAVLKDGDEIRVGKVRFRFELNGIDITTP